MDTYRFRFLLTILGSTYGQNMSSKSVRYFEYFPREKWNTTNSALCYVHVRSLLSKDTDTKVLFDTFIRVIHKFKVISDSSPFFFSMSIWSKIQCKKRWRTVSVTLENTYEKNFGSVIGLLSLTRFWWFQQY